MKLRKIAIFIVLFLFILPFVLNQIWYVGGSEWMYWLSSYLCYSQILILGFLLVVMVVLPRKLGIWLSWLNNDSSPYEQKLSMKITYFVYGLILVTIGIFLLGITTGRFLRECQPLSSCF